MDKIEKFLRALNAKDQQVVLLVLEQLKRDYRLIPGVKKLTGKQDFFRVRLGRYRIIFVVHKDQSVEIIRVTKRDEETYKNL